MSLLGLDYEASDSDSATPAGAKVGESPEGTTNTALKKSNSLVGLDYEGGDDGESMEPAPEAEEASGGEAANLEVDASPVLNNDSGMPLSPTGTVSADLQAICEKLYATTEKINFNNHLRESHAFRNPEILPKLVQSMELDSFGTCYSKELFDPSALTDAMYFDTIYREQNRMLANRQAKAKAAKTKKEASGAKVSKVVGGVPVVRQSSAGSGAVLGSAGFGTRKEAKGEPAKKKSKWDNRANSGGGGAASSGDAYADFKKAQALAAAAAKK